MKCPRCEAPLCCDTCDCSRGQRLDAVMARIDAAYAARRAAGYPSSGPEVAELDAAYASLREWTVAK